MKNNQNVSQMYECVAPDQCAYLGWRTEPCCHRGWPETSLPPSGTSETVTAHRPTVTYLQTSTLINTYSLSPPQWRVCHLATFPPTALPEITQTVSTIELKTVVDALNNYMISVQAQVILTI